MSRAHLAVVPNEGDPSSSSTHPPIWGVTTEIGNASEVPALITAQEAAGLLGVAVSTLRDWVARGVGPRSYRLGPKHLRFDPQDIYEFMLSKRSDVGS